MPQSWTTEGDKRKAVGSQANWDGGGHPWKASEAEAEKLRRLHVRRSCFRICEAGSRIADVDL